MGLFRRKKLRDQASDREDQRTFKVPEKKDRRCEIPPPVLMLLTSVQELDKKPPVTLALIGVMYLLHIHASRTPSFGLLLALCPGKVVATKSLDAVLLAPFLHFEDKYLYQSLVSLLWKGYKLEERLGSIGFCVLLVYLITISQALILLGAYVVSGGAMHECFTGFSSVLTAMKVILTVNTPTFTTLYNFKVPTKYAAWLELLITYLFVPKLPLLAQGAGLLTGYIYIMVPKADALVGRASRSTRQFLVRIGFLKRSYQWWHLWPRFRSFVRRRKRLRK